MSIRAMLWAFQQKCPTPSAKLVLIKLADHANDEGECWPSQGRVAEDTGLTRETVNRQVKALADLGLLSIQQRTNGTGQLPNRYILRCDIPSQGGVTDNHTPVILDHTPCDERSHKPSLQPSKNNTATSVADAGASSSDPVKDIFDRGLAILGSNRRSLLGKMRATHGDPAVLAAIVACENELPSDPAAFFVACCEERSKRNGTHRPDAGTALFEGGARAVAAIIQRERLARDRGADYPIVEPLLGTD